MRRSKRISRRGRSSRREFIKKSAVATAAVVAGCAPKVSETVTEQAAAPAVGAGIVGANDRLVVGFVGVGGQGFNSHVMTVKNYGAEHNVVGGAVCDVWSKRTERARAELELSESDAYTDYRRLLERDDLDAVFIGTVDHWHTRVAVEAMESGKHVYCEKPMTRYLGEAFEIHDAVARTGKVFQIGSQYCTEGKWHRAAQLIRDGRIGPPVLGQNSYCRNEPNGEWNYEIDPDLGPDSMDWSWWLGPVSDRPFSADEYHRWRKYYPYCCGILGDLLAHRIHPLLIATGNPEFPTRVACTGTRMITPDRDVPDTTQLIAEFPSGLSIIVTGSTVNEQGLDQVIRGHEATLYFGGNAVELRPERPFADLVDPDKYDNIEPGVSIPAHVANWYDGIREGITPNGNIDVAIKAQTIISLAEMSERLGEMMHFDAETRTVKAGSKEMEPITYGTLELS
jgi:predicted dehydrogenase